MELGRLAEKVLPMLRQGARLAMEGNARELSDLSHMETEVGMLHAPILDYLQELSKKDLSSKEAELLHHYLTIASYYESIGDNLKLHLIHVGRKRLHEELSFSEETRKLFNDLVSELIHLLEESTQAVTRMNKKPARNVVKAKSRISELSAHIERHIVRRMSAEAPMRRLTYQTETELLEALKRVYYFTKRIAKEVLITESVTASGEAPAH
jgi:phosphate:Na+ symporter